jgi:hypothetical protein
VNGQLEKGKVVIIIAIAVVALCGVWLLYWYITRVASPTFDDRDRVVYCDNKL